MLEDSGLDLRFVLNLQGTSPLSESSFQVFMSVSVIAFSCTSPHRGSTYVFSSERYQLILDVFSPYFKLWQSSTTSLKSVV